MQTNTVIKMNNQTFQVSRSSLLEFLKLAKVGNDKLGIVTFSVADGQLIAQLSNRSVQMSINLGSGYSEQFPVMVSLKDLLHLSKAFPDEKLDMTWDSKHFYIGKANITASTEVSVSYFQPEVSLYKFPSLAIRDAMPAILKIIDTDQLREYSTVALLDVKPTRIRFVGTDGFRLVYSDFSGFPAGLNILDGICLPAIACEQLLMMAKSGAELSMGISEDRTTLAVVFADCRVNFRLSSIKYPNYVSILPKAKIGQSFVVKELLVLVKQALVTTDKSRILEFFASKGLLTIRSHKESCDPYSMYQLAMPGGEFHLDKKISLNGKFLVDCLLSTKEKVGSIYFSSDPEEPIRIVLGSVETILVPVKMN